MDLLNGARHWPVSGVDPSGRKSAGCSARISQARLPNAGDLATHARFVATIWVPGGVNGLLVRLLGGRFLALLTSVLVVAGCSGQPTALPTQPPNTVILEGLLDGAELHHLGESCWWFEVRGRVYDAVWPAGFTARTEPPAILDAAGEEVARPGEVYDVGGGQGTSLPLSGQCRMGNDVWWVGELIARRP